MAETARRLGELCLTHPTDDFTGRWFVDEPF
jgi:hypothetical protein